MEIECVCGNTRKSVARCGIAFIDEDAFWNVPRFLPPSSLWLPSRIRSQILRVSRPPLFLGPPRHSSTSFVGSRRMPHSRNTPRMSSAHRCTAVFSWSFSFCRTVACTPSRPRTQGTDMYTSLSVPWEQLCERRFLELVRRVNQHANKWVSELCLTRKCSRKNRRNLKINKIQKVYIN